MFRKSNTRQVPGVDGKARLGEIGPCVVQARPNQTPTIYQNQIKRINRGEGEKEREREGERGNGYFGRETFPTPFGAPTFNIKPSQ